MRMQFELKAAVNAYQETNTQRNTNFAIKPMIYKINPQILNYEFVYVALLRSTLLAQC